ncbi:hypothetical protein D3C85_1145790 [compost metagenome]
MIHSERGCRKTEHHEREFTGHKCTCCEWHTITELRHEDVLVTPDNLTSLAGVFSEFEPEWRIENVMQTEWNERPLNHTEDKRGHGTVRIDHVVRQVIQPVLNWWPYNNHEQSD